MPGRIGSLITHASGREPLLFDLTFEQPGWLWTLLVLPIVVAGYLWFERRRRSVAGRFASPEMQSNLLEQPPGWRRHVPPILYALALTALCVAAARPFHVTFERREHATVILTIDSSNSMLSTDVRPSRLAAARLAAETFLDRVPSGFPVGIVSFARRVHLLSPPTLDRQNLRAALESLSPRPGTAIGDALASSLRLLPKAGPAGSDSVVLLTDGNQTAGRADPLTAARTAAAKGVRIYTVAVGTKRAPPGSGVVAGAPNRLLLAQMAAATGGAAYSASSSSQLNDIYSQLGGTVVLLRRLDEITWVFIAVAALLALLGAALAGLWLRRIP